MVKSRLEPSRLLRREWAALWLVGGLLLTLTVTVTLNRPSRLPQTEGSALLFAKRKIEVEIEGAVVHAGRYELPAGSTLADLLKQAGTVENSDLLGVDLGQRLRNHQKIALPAVRWISVELFGDGVEPQTVRLRDGATVGDLLSQVELKSDAALWRLRKRQLLNDGDQLEIQQKRTKKR